MKNKAYSPPEFEFRLLLTEPLCDLEGELSYIEEDNGENGTL
jgi:hypothetical protein